MLVTKITLGFGMVFQKYLSKFSVAALVMVSICIYKSEVCSATSVWVSIPKKYNNPVSFEVIKDEVVEVAKRHGYKPFLIEIEQFNPAFQRTPGTNSGRIFVEYNIQFIKHYETDNLAALPFVQVKVRFEIFNSQLSKSVQDEIKCIVERPVFKLSTRVYDISEEAKFLELIRSDTLCEEISENVKSMSGGIK